MENFEKDYDVFNAASKAITLSYFNLLGKMNEDELKIKNKLYLLELPKCDSETLKNILEIGRATKREERKENN